MNEVLSSELQMVLPSVMRTLTVLAISGLLLFAFGPSTPLAVAGAVLWGSGVSLGFSVGMSAAADKHALAARVSAMNR